MAVNPNNIPGVTGSPPAPGVTTRATQVSYYASILGGLPGTYQGNQKAYDGLTWSQLYEKLAAANPNQDPKAIADTVLGIADTQGVVTQAIKPAVDSASTTANAIAKGANAFANEVPKISNPLDFLGEIGDFFHRLTQASTWIRIAKVLAGGALLLIGLSHITGVDNKVADIARNVKVLPI